MMGEVKITARLATTNEDEHSEIEFLVDTGTMYSYIPTSLCEELGIELLVRRQSVVANNRRLDIRMGIAHVEINGRDAPVIVGALDVPIPLLGFEALEGLGFKVNPVDQTLEIARPFPETPIL